MVGRRGLRWWHCGYWEAARGAARVLARSATSCPSAHTLYTTLFARSDGRFDRGWLFFAKKRGLYE